MIALIFYFLLSFVSVSEILSVKDSFSDTCVHINAQDNILRTKRVCIFENRLDEPIVLTFYTDKCQYIKTKCSFQDRKLVSNQEFKYNWMSRQKQIKYFTQEENKWASPFGGKISSSVHSLPLIEAYENGLPMIWFLNSMEELRLITDYFKAAVRAYNIPPSLENKLLIILEEKGAFSPFFDMTGKKEIFEEQNYAYSSNTDFSVSLVEEKTTRKKSQFLSSYFTLVTAGEEKELLLNLHRELIDKMSVIEGASFDTIHDSTLQGAKEALLNMFKNFGPKDTAYLGGLGTVLTMLKSYLEKTSKDSEQQNKHLEEQNRNWRRNHELLEAQQSALGNVGDVVVSAMEEFELHYDESDPNPSPMGHLAPNYPCSSPVVPMGAPHTASAVPSSSSSPAHKSQYSKIPASASMPVPGPTAMALPPYHMHHHSLPAAVPPQELLLHLQHAANQGNLEHQHSSSGMSVSASTSASPVHSRRRPPKQLDNSNQLSRDVVARSVEVAKKTEVGSPSLPLERRPTQGRLKFKRTGSQNSPNSSSTNRSDSVSKPVGRFRRTSGGSQLGKKAGASFDSEDSVAIPVSPEPTSPGLDKTFSFGVPHSGSITEFRKSSTDSPPGEPRR